MIGVILCGGKSTRMGVDKGLLLKQGKAWAQIAFEKLSQLPLSCVLSINESQGKAYSSLISSYPVVIDYNDLEVGGPLLGILSVHQQFPSEDLFVLACDMVNMEVQVLDELLLERTRSKEFQSYVFRGEPLCGIYTSEGLSKVLHSLKKKRIQSHSMRHILDDVLKTRYLPIIKERQNYFKNFNSQEDLKKS